MFRTSPAVRNPATSITVVFSPGGNSSGLFTGSGRAKASANSIHDHVVILKKRCIIRRSYCVVARTGESEPSTDAATRGPEFASIILFAYLVIQYQYF